MDIAPVERTKQDANWALALSPLVGPLSWTVFFIVGYLVAEAGCTVGGWAQAGGGLRYGPWHLVVAVAALALLASGVIVWGALRSYRRWRRAVEETDDPEANVPFMARAALILNLLFLLVTATTAVGLFFTLPCQWT